MKNNTWTFEAKDHIHIYLHPRQMGKRLSSFPLINSNYLIGKISHWMYLSLFPLSVVWGGGACHLSPNFLSLSLLWGADKMAWVIWLFGSFIVLFSPLELFIGQKGRVDRTSFEVKHLAWMSRYVASNHSNKKIKCFIKSSLSLYCAPIEWSN